MEHKTKQPMDIEEISLRLEQMDDIFSDFDVRPYSKRALSVDFIEEIKRASHDKEDHAIEIALHLPKTERNEYHETVIRERLNAHFNKHYHRLLKEKKRIMRLGGGMATLGVICMLLASLAIFENPEKHFGLSLLVVFLEPAAWFLLWEGMDQIIFNSKDIRPNLDFYRKMTTVKDRIHFVSY